MNIIYQNEIGVTTPCPAERFLAGVTPAMAEMAISIFNQWHNQDRQLRAWSEPYVLCDAGGWYPVIIPSMRKDEVLATQKPLIGVELKIMLRPHVRAALEAKLA